ncbi:MAG: DUF3604 domain-containing protein [Deltaproteobacteria bacterium]|nr:DUF3604 domain-containing protein [Deltaproteobacteria bacterium]
MIQWKMRARAGFVLAAAVLLSSGCGDHEGPGEIVGETTPPEALGARVARQAIATDGIFRGVGYDQRPRKQILFGDFHVHTTYSADAFITSLAVYNGDGTHPMADACDYARYCSALDFWSINDHAEAMTPAHWDETKESIRECNDRAGDPLNPDMVSFLGWEWSHIRPTAEEHFGHKNVIVYETDEDKVPKRVISSLDPEKPRPDIEISLLARLAFPIVAPDTQRVLDMQKYEREVTSVPMCEVGVDTRELPDDCHETAPTPDILFEKLAQGGWESVVIPHGNTWGFYSPVGTSWDKQLVGEMHDPNYQTMVEMYSGHGNSEEYRGWRDVAYDSAGAATCPEPSEDYLACCHQAGEIIRDRCAEDVSDEACEARVETARQNYVDAGILGWETVPGASVEDWLDCGQCRDCFNPSFAYRPKGSTQYAMALSNFDEAGEPKRFRFGFIGSSDNHLARPGTGYKEIDRHDTTEANGPMDETWAGRLRTVSADPTPESTPVAPFKHLGEFLRRTHAERQMSFFMTGGLVAVHAEGRHRRAIWDAMGRREVYGTSGERMLLWFDLANGSDGRVAMGSEATVSAPPRFRVRAVGSPKQQDGCPDYAVRGLGAERLESLCRSECHNPSDERHLISRIEVVRIRPQVRPGEPVEDLIEDPWRRFACAPDTDGCAVEFDDPDFLAGGREAIYYVRAVQEPTPAINAGNLRCKYDGEGNCIEVDPCYGGYQTDKSDDCLSPNEERAWSSPIFVSPAG